ncbi:MAG: hypothetical protein WDN28_21165 [Chthoniobacter sp.]
MPFHPVAAFTFWISCGLLFYTFAGYGWLISILARWRPKASSSREASAPPPSVSVVLVACNEETHIAGRLRNLLAAQYPPEKLGILLVSDGSTDTTAAPGADPPGRASRDHRTASARRQSRRPQPRPGAMHGGNRGSLPTPARSSPPMPSPASPLISRNPAIGAVSGALEIAAAASATGSGVDAYWRYEKSLRAAESRFDSCIGCTGAIYALRRRLFVPIPEDTLLDDVIIPLQAAAQGARVLHDATAFAFDPQPLEPKAESRRKRRTLAGGFQMLFRYPAWLLPRGHRPLVAAHLPQIPSAARSFPPPQRPGQQYRPGRPALLRGVPRGTARPLPSRGPWASSTRAPLEILQPPPLLSSSSISRSCAACATISPAPAARAGSHV